VFSGVKPGPAESGDLRTPHSRSFRSFRKRYANQHIDRRGETLVAETLVVGRRCPKKACEVLMMPILRS